MPVMEWDEIVAVAEDRGQRTESPDSWLDLAAWWPGRVKAPKLYDFSGNANTGTWAGTGSHWAADAQRQGVVPSFNGTDDRGDIDAAQSKLAGLTQESVSAWIYLESYGDAGQAYIRQIVGDDVNSNDICIGFRVGSDGTLANRDKLYGAGAGRDGIAGTTSLALSTWYHVVFTRQSLGRKRLYINGELEADAAASYHVNPANPTGVLQLGDDNNRNRYWAGRIDDVRLYSRILSAAEIRYIYDRGRVAPLSDLVEPVGWHPVGVTGGVVVPWHLFGRVA